LSFLYRMELIAPRLGCCLMSSCNCPPVAKSMSFGALQKVNDRRYPRAWSRQQKGVPNRALAIFLVAAIVIVLVLPALGDERPGDPFGNHTAELNKDAPLVRTWESLRDKMRFEKAYFHECLLLKEPSCPSISTLVQKLDEIRQYQGKALLGHLNISVNLMIEPASSEWTGPLEAITMRHGDCKAYSLAKYAGAQELGISADHVRLIIVHDRRHHFDHMVAAVYQKEEWFILDNLTNLLLRDWEKTDYEPLAILDYRGVRRYLSAFWTD
jgi:predicted transglutaminase-like cysteine proteinase